MMSFQHGGIMRRAQIQLDERTYAVLRRRAFERGCSFSALVREMLAGSLGRRAPKQRLTLKQFGFIGVGRSRQGRLSPVSERHDEALADAFAKPRRR
ncbi:MAG TPA: hypothetical protein VGW35_06860 [Methylomirabilota bacterium]|jgi:hypothetical protein|nr:hypothetical protein [Methylomirabilota bacterium]